MTLPECTTQDLTKEKSLWDIYSASRRIHSGKFNKMATSIVFGLLFYNVGLVNKVFPAQLM